MQMLGPVLNKEFKLCLFGPCPGEFVIKYLKQWQEVTQNLANMDIHSYSASLSDTKMNI